MVLILDAKLVQVIQIELMLLLQRVALVIAKLDFTNQGHWWFVKLAILLAILALDLLIWNVLCVIIQLIC